MLTSTHCSRISVSKRCTSTLTSCTTLHEHIYSIVPVADVVTSGKERRTPKGVLVVKSCHSNGSNPA